MSIFVSPRFLSRVMAVDAVSCLATGGLQLALAGPMAALTGLPADLLVASGAFLVVYAALAGWIARREQPPRILIGLIALGNLGWGIGCIGLMAAGPWPLGGWGMAWLAAQAITVLVLAELQWTGLRRTRRTSGAVPARS
ncbi:MAG: hypothetical protein EOO24_26095 [Comamonadaceae bacterium]|nr:MAG: hypothetical protein EOO24_26095 [Comamonadaceae bacterium]